MDDRVLFVDDEKNILLAIKRQLRKSSFSIDTAESGYEALEMIGNKNYSVVVSDMRMPEMDGIQLLRQIKKKVPETVRMMLTGNADQETAIQAVNEGNIFRFLNKPCPTDLLLASVKAAVEQYHLIIAEKELLDKTLKGSIKVVTEILSQVNPATFSCSSRIKLFVTQMARYLKLPSLWQFSIAGFLSQIGCVTVPNDILEKVYNGMPLNAQEQTIYDSHPEAGARLLANIPRLENIARMIGLQRLPFCQYPDKPRSSSEKLVFLGGQMLKAAIDFDHHVFLGLSPEEAVLKMGRSGSQYNQNIVKIIKLIQPATTGYAIKKLKLGQVFLGMKLNQDVRALNGLLLAVKGQEITLSLRERLVNFSKTIGIEEPFEVLIQT